MTAISILEIQSHNVFFKRSFVLLSKSFSLIQVSQLVAITDVKLITSNIKRIPLGSSCKVLPSSVVKIKLLV